MKSIKPGRGPSAMDAMGSIIAVVFGIFWTIMASKSGAPIFFPIFGVLFIIIGIIQAFYHFKNATSANRFSEYDITDSTEESDPLQKMFGNNVDTNSVSSENMSTREGSNFCPYCGNKVNSDFEFCQKCGKKLP